MYFSIICHNFKIGIEGENTVMISEMYHMPEKGEVKNTGICFFSPLFFFFLWADSQKPLLPYATYFIIFL